MARVVVHVTPKAVRDEVCGWKGAELVVRVTAAPEAGKANAAVERTLAKALGVPKSSVSVVRGQTARIKTVEIDGVADDDVVRTFGEPDARLW